MLSLSCILGISANHFESFALGAILSKVVNSDKEKEKKRKNNVATAFSCITHPPPFAPQYKPQTQHHLLEETFK
jgi:hypothetical protein